MNYHYVYRITNKILNKHYYGVRTSKHDPKDDLGVKYFSSSSDKYFIKDQKINPQDYRYKVICVCKNRHNAVLLEIKLHNKFNVGINESFYNRAKQTSTGWDRRGSTYICTDETRVKIGNIHRGKIMSEESRKKMSDSGKLKIFTDEHKHNLSKGSKGKPKSDDHRTNISRAQQNGNGNFRGGHHTEETKQKMFKIVSCPSCSKSGTIQSMSRWHFDNCKKLNK